MEQISFSSFTSAINLIEGCLILTLPSELNDKGIAEFGNSLLDRIKSFRARGIIIDFSAVDILDSREFKQLADISLMTDLLGVKSVFVGISPGIVISLLDLSVKTDGITSFLSMEDALEYFKEQSTEQIPNDGVIDEEETDEFSEEEGESDE